MHTKNKLKTCAITGSNGYLGSHLCKYFANNNYRVIKLSRCSNTDFNHRHYSLNSNLDTKLLEDVDVLIHCAYDFNPINTNILRKINVEGSSCLFSAAYKAGVKKIIYISSVAAYNDCKSIYGKIKLEIEGIAFRYKALVIRPCLIYGDNAGGMFGNLTENIKRSKFIPIISKGRQTVFLLHIDDLCENILLYANNSFEAPDIPITAGHQKPVEFKYIIQNISNSLNKKSYFINIPWKLVWVIIKIAEFFHIKSKFRSDSILSLTYPNTNPDFSINKTLGLSFRPYVYHIFK